MYRVEHIKFIVGQGISYNETIDNIDTKLTASQLAEYYEDFLIDDDWLTLIDNETNEVIATTEEGR